MTTLPTVRRPLVLTMGEPAGIGGEITLKAWLARASLPPFMVVDDAGRLRRLAAVLGLDVPIRPVVDGADALATFAQALPVIDRPLACEVTPGHPDRRNGVAVSAAIEAAVELVQAGEGLAVVTNPIHKKSLYDAGFRFPGHTEFLAELAGTTLPVMMLACDALRVVPVTVHLSLRQAIETLSTEAIVQAAKVTDRALRADFGLTAPRLAVAGLNPHAGEDGEMGSEDQAIIAPAVARLRADGIDAIGPLPPDTHVQRPRPGRLRRGDLHVP